LSTESERCERERKRGREGLKKRGKGEGKRQRERQRERERERGKLLLISSFHLQEIQWKGSVAAVAAAEVRRE
jgi:hypothetical protein